MSPDRSLRRIVQGIRQGKSVLFLGPDVAKNTSNQLIRNELLHFLKIENETDFVYDATNEFFVFRNEMSKFEVYSAIQEFYADLQPHPIYEQIAQIPFPLIISFNPDLLLNQTFENQDLEYVFQYYSATEPRGINELEAPSAEVPLIYNLAGNIEDDTSLIFGYNDLLNYIPSISGAKKIPNVVRRALKSAGQGNAIFLGFQFDKWYVKLLLKILGVSGGYALGFEENTQSPTHIFCVNRLEIRFIEHDMDDFIHELHQIFTQENGLRVPVENAESDFIKNIKAKVAQNKIEIVIEDLLDELEEKDEDLFDEVIQISARFNGLQRKINRRLIREDDQQIAEAQLKEAILQILRKMRQQEI